MKLIKCVIWDLDHTLWEGVLSEDDKVELKEGIKDIIIELDSRGILHSIASKNNYTDAINQLKVFSMDQYFLYPQISWDAKSYGVSEIQKKLNIGMDTILFIDDQLFELDEVKSVHSEITCMNALEYKALLDNPRLVPEFITEDSKRRRFMYLEDMDRQEAERSYQGPHDKFLSSLNMRFTITEAKEEDLKRAEELTIRTNQLNSTGKCYGYEELMMYLKSSTHKLYVCELTDKYGSYGKIGIALVEVNETQWLIKLLLMSCRVMSRGVGTILLSYIMKQAKQEGKRLLADFRVTERNKMMHVTYVFSNFQEISNDGEGNIIFENDLSIIQDYPKYVDVKTTQNT